MTLLQAKIFEHPQHLDLTKLNRPNDILTLEKIREKLRHKIFPTVIDLSLQDDLQKLEHVRSDPLNVPYVTLILHVVTVNEGVDPLPQIALGEDSQ